MCLLCVEAPIRPQETVKVVSYGAKLLRFSCHCETGERRHRLWQSVLLAHTPPFPLAPLCKGICHGVTEGSPAAGRRKRTLKLLSLPCAVIRQSTPHRFAELPLHRGAKGTGETDCHDQCAHWSRNDTPRPVRRTASRPAPPRASHCVGPHPAPCPAPLCASYCAGSRTDARRGQLCTVHCELCTVSTVSLRNQ